MIWIWQTHLDIPRAGPAFPDFADASFKNAVVQIGSGKLVVGTENAIQEHQAGISPGQ